MHLKAKAEKENSYCQRNSKYLLLANEVNFSEGARNCWGRVGGGGLPNHATEGSDFILTVTSNKGYPEDLNRVLRFEFGKRRRVTVLAPKELKRNYASASSSWTLSKQLLSAASAGRNA